MDSRVAPQPTPGGYRILADSALRDYLGRLPAIAARLGGSPEAWSVTEVGDGNLNLVFKGRAAASR